MSRASQAIALSNRHIPRKTSVYAYDYERARIEAKRAMRRLSKIQDHVSRIGSRPAAEKGVDLFDLYSDEKCVNPCCDKAAKAIAALEEFLNAPAPPTYGRDR